VARCWYQRHHSSVGTNSGNALVQRYAGDACRDGELLIGAGFDPCPYPLEHSSVRSLADTVRYDGGELLIDAASQPAQFLADLGFW
jgi:hypothetical protein